MVDVQTVVGLRVLGARVVSIDDETVAEPAPESAVRVQWLVVSDRLERYSARLWACETTRAATGIPECSSEPFHDEPSSNETALDLSFEFELPRLPVGSEWLAKLSLCTSGRAEFSASGAARCSDGSQPLESQTRVRVADGDANHHPNLDDDVLRLGGARWTELGSTGIGEGCAAADTALPTVERGQATSIRFRAEGDDRETLPEILREEHGANDRESLLFTHVATLPGLDRPFSALDANSTERGFDVDFQLERDVRLGDSGTIAGFFLIVRDDRGGIDWTARRLCAKR
jgi:hypothetical protein